MLPPVAPTHGRSLQYVRQMAFFRVLRSEVSALLRRATGMGEPVQNYGYPKKGNIWRFITNNNPLLSRSSQTGYTMIFQRCGRVRRCCPYLAGFPCCRQSFRRSSEEAGAGLPVPPGSGDP